MFQVKQLNLLFIKLVALMFVSACGGGGSSTGGGSGPATWAGNYFGDLNFRACDNTGVCDTASLPSELVVFSDNSIQINVDGDPGSRTGPNVIDSAGNFGVSDVVVDFSVNGQGPCRLRMNLSGNVNGKVANMTGAISLTCPNGAITGDYNFTGTKGVAKAWSQERLDGERQKLTNMLQ